jgi:hypothetical protein
VLFDDPEYLRDYDDFADWLCAGLLGDGSKPLDSALSDATLEALGRYASRLMEAEEGAGTISGPLIHQVLYAMRERAAPPWAPEVCAKWTAQGQALQKKFYELLARRFPP